MLTEADVAPHARRCRPVQAARCRSSQRQSTDRQEMRSCSTPRCAVAEVEVALRVGPRSREALERPRRRGEQTLKTNAHLGKETSEESFPTPVEHRSPGGKPQRLTARAKIARARPDRFWPGEALFDLSVCVCEFQNRTTQNSGAQAGASPGGRAYMCVCPCVRGARATSPNLGVRWENRRLKNSGRAFEWRSSWLLARRCARRSAS